MVSLFFRLSHCLSEKKRTRKKRGIKREGKPSFIYLYFSRQKKTKEYSNGGRWDNLIPA